MPIRLAARAQVLTPVTTINGIDFCSALTRRVLIATESSGQHDPPIYFRHRLPPHCLRPVPHGTSLFRTERRRFGKVCSGALAFIGTTLYRRPSCGASIAATLRPWCFGKIMAIRICPSGLVRACP